MIPPFDGKNFTQNKEAVALTTIQECGGERGEDIPSWEEINAWWKAGLLDPSEGETKESSHEGRWGQQKAVHWEQVTEDITSFSATTCPEGGACPPGSCVDPIEGYSSSCSSGSKEGDSSEFEHSCNKQSGAAFNSSVVVSPVPDMSEETSCRKVTCDVPPDASSCRVFVEVEVSSWDVGTYTCQAGETVTGLMGENGTFERRHESSGNSAFVRSAAESGRTVSRDTTSPSDDLYGTHSTSLFVYNQFALVTRHANFDTDTTDWQVNSYSVSDESSGMLSDPDTRQKPVQCLIPEVPPARPLGGTTFGKSCTMVGDEEFTLTGLGGDGNQQTLGCAATGHFTSWKECERVRCVIPPGIVSGALDVCTDCSVSFGGASPYSCSLGITLDGSPQSRKTSSASCHVMGRYTNRQHDTVLVCKVTKRRLRSAALVSKPVPVVKHGELVPRKGLSGSSVARSPVGDIRWEAKRRAAGVQEYPGETLTCV